MYCATPAGLYRPRNDDDDSRFVVAARLLLPHQQLHQRCTAPSHPTPPLPALSRVVPHTGTDDSHFVVVALLLLAHQQLHLAEAHAGLQLLVQLGPP